MVNVLNFSNTADEHRITIDASAEHAMKVYFPKQITKFVELGNRLWGLIPSNDSFFEKYDKAKKKVNFNRHVEVMPNECSLCSLRVAKVQIGLFSTQLE